MPLTHPGSGCRVQDAGPPTRPVAMRYGLWAMTEIAIAIGIAIAIEVDATDLDFNTDSGTDGPISRQRRTAINSFKP